MKIILYSKNKQFKVLIDKDDWEKIKHISWYIQKQKNHKFRVQTKLSNRTMRLHRFILNVTNPNIKVDHINGNPLDNRRKNLRICSNAENSKNQDLRDTNTSGYKGVTWDKARKKWKAWIMVNYKGINLGRFILKKDAAKAYNEAAIKYFGEFARLNEVK